VSLETRLVLGAICAFNAVIMLALAVISFEYVNGRAGDVGAIVFSVGSIALFALSHRLRPYRNG
jgi:hypothetical protein